MTDGQLSRVIARAAEDETVELDLTWREIRSLPPTGASLTRLQRLSLRSNWLQELPPKLAQLPNLKALDVSDNLLDDEFPAPIMAMSQLEELDIGRSSLETLPEGFARLRNLRKLLLEFADLKDFPRALLALPDLAEVNLYGNALCELPPDIGQMTALGACSWIPITFLFGQRP